MRINSQYARLLFVKQMLNKAGHRLAGLLQPAMATLLAVLALGFALSLNEHTDNISQRKALAADIASHYVHSLERQIHNSFAAAQYVGASIKSRQTGRDERAGTATAFGQWPTVLSEIHLIPNEPAGKTASLLIYRKNEKKICPDTDAVALEMLQASGSRGPESGLLDCEDAADTVIGHVRVPLQNGNRNPAASGAVLVFLDLREIVESSGIGHLQRLGYNYELLHINKFNDPRTVIRSENPPDQPLSYQFTTSGHVWELQVSPVEGWVTWGPTLKYALLSVAVGALAAILANILSRLIHTQRRLRSSEQRFRDLTELSSDWWWEQDDQFRFTAVAGTQSYAGLSSGDHIGKTRWELDHTHLPYDKPWDDHIRLLRRHKPFRNLVIERRTADGTRRLRVTGKPLFGPDGQFAGYRGVATDVTDEFNALQALRNGEANFRGIFNVSPDPMVVRNADDTIRQVNPAACRFFGASRPRDLIGKSWFDLYPPDEREIALQRSKLLIHPQTPIPVARRRFLRLDGKIIIGEITGLLLANRAGRMVLTVIHDSSERDAVAHRYEILQREITRRIIETREHERRALSIELHDRIGQTLTAVRFNLEFLREQIPQSTLPLIEDGLSNIHDLLRTMSMHVRDLMAELHPPALDDHGLRTALAFHLDKVSQRSGIVAELHGYDFKPRLSQDKELMLFRIAQEAIHNVIKHAESTKILVSLHSDDRHLELTIADNGIGFEPALVNSSKFGLRIMRERAEAIGARLEIRHVRGIGTQIIVTLDRENNRPK